MDQKATHINTLITEYLDLVALLEQALEKYTKLKFLYAELKKENDRLVNILARVQNVEPETAKQTGEIEEGKDVATN